MATSRRIQADVLRDFCTRLFKAVGTPPEIAEVVARILVNSDLKGHLSHGVYQIPGYIRGMEKKELIPDATPEIIRQTASTAFVDSHCGWGHYAGQWCMHLAIEKARATGMGAVSIVNSHHIGRLGEYAEQAAAEGFAAILVTGGRSVGGASPFGGAEGALGTNPIAFGFPSADGRHFISDFATTAIAGAKIHIARIKGTTLPPGSIIDKHGHPSVDPEDFYDGGRLLVFGGYKGYAISLLTCLLGGLAGVTPDSGDMGGTYFQAIDISAFQPLEDYQVAVKSFLNGIRSIPPAPGFSEVLVPGDPERNAEAEQLREGIELPEKIRQELLECAEKYNVTASLG
jgi:uncharacterized oxidoreductase